jgi:hypothetical protein
VRRKDERALRGGAIVCHEARGVEILELINKDAEATKGPGSLLHCIFMERMLSDLGQDARGGVPPPQFVVLLHDLDESYVVQRGVVAEEEHHPKYFVTREADAAPRLAALERFPRKIVLRQAAVSPHLGVPHLSLQRR